EYLTVQVRQAHAERLRLPCDRAPGSADRRVPQPRSRCQNALPRGRIHRSAVVEHARDRGYRNVRLTRHVTDRRPHLDLLAGVPPRPSDPPTAGCRAGGAAVPLALETFIMLRHGMQAFRYSTAER